MSPLYHISLPDLHLSLSSANFSKLGGVGPDQPIVYDTIVSHVFTHGLLANNLKKPVSLVSNSAAECCILNDSCSDGLA